jgi:hypothetical protein
MLHNASAQLNTLQALHTRTCILCMADQMQAPWAVGHLQELIDSGRVFQDPSTGVLFEGAEPERDKKVTHM